jgi:N-acetyl-beta-hexosaminidase
MKKALFVIFVLAFLASCKTSRNQYLPQTSLEIIPKPQSLTILDQEDPDYGGFKMNAKTVITSQNDENEGNAAYLQEKLGKLFGTTIEITTTAPESNFIELKLVEGLESDSSKIESQEAYQLVVNTNGISILATSPAGAFYGIQTLMQLLPSDIYAERPSPIKNSIIPSLNILDYPRFEYRGIMLDCSRTFFDVTFIKNFIDWISYHKINNFHWHLADDQGWRVEIKKYPRLTEIGAWRGENEALMPVYGSGMERNGGFYTQDEIKKIVKYASDRNVNIIPEIDLPGHSKAVAVAYPEIVCPVDEKILSVQGEANNVWCVGREENYVMLEDIISEMIELFPSKEFHIGGDEVNMDAWKICPHCQQLMKENGMKEPVELENYFVRRLEKILASHGRSMAGWDEILDGGELMPTSTVYAWRNLESGLQSVNAGQPTVMHISQYMYFDMKQSIDERGLKWAGIAPLEKTYEFDPIGKINLTEEQKKLVLGPQGGLWTECMQYPEHFAEYQLFPKTCALSEIGWSAQEMKEINDFKKRLNDIHFERMDKMGIQYRVAPPIVVFENGSLTASTDYSSLTIRYTDDKTDPTNESRIYESPIATDNPANYRFATFFNGRSSIARGAQNVDLHQYIYPQTTVETNISSDQDVNCLADKDLWTYYTSDRPLQKGDYVLFTFDEPVECSKISMSTGYYTLTLFGVPNGNMEYSIDGQNFIKGQDFYRDDKEGYMSFIVPTDPVKAVKVNVTGIGEGEFGIIQDLRIEK